MYSTYFFIPVFLTPLIHQNAPYIHWTWESIINTRSQTSNKIRLSVREKGKHNLNIQEFLVLIYGITLCNKWGGLLVEYFDSSNSLNMWTRNVRNFKEKVAISWYHLFVFTVISCSTEVQLSLYDQRNNRNQKQV